MDTATKKYLIKFFTACAVYVLMVFLADMFLEKIDNAFLKHILAIAPLIPALIAAKIMVKHIRTLDEVQRAIISESAVIALFVVAFGTLTYGFLESFLGYPSVSFTWVFPATSFAYGGATFFVSRKYL